MKTPSPLKIELHQRSRLLEVEFDSGERFLLPYEYLRVYSPSAEVRGHGRQEPELVLGKALVGVRGVRPVGQYGIVLEFDDGHDTGIYSWDVLYELGRDQERNWARYLERLAAAGYRRDVPESSGRGS